MGIEPEWAQQVMDDVDLVAFEPEPKSRMGASRFIGFSADAGRLLVVIAFRDADGDRSKVHSIRLSDEEQARVEQVADAKHLPASTLVRSWILDRLNQEKTA